MASQSACSIRSLHVEFTDPSVKLAGENRSKLLKPGSDLHTFITSAQEALAAAGLRLSSYRPPHIEVSYGPPTEAERNARALELHHREVPLVLTRLGGALVVNTGSVTGYGETHATVAHFAVALTPELEAAARMALSPLLI